jgi:thioredoxin
LTIQPEALDASGLSVALSRTGTPLLVDFWAPWCGPCRATMPVFEQLAGELAGRCALGTVNVEAYPDLARRFEVRAIPTILLFSGGKVVGRAVGAQSREQLLKLVGAII